MVETQESKAWFVQAFVVHRDPETRIHPGEGYNELELNSVGSMAHGSALPSLATIHSLPWFLWHHLLFLTPVDILLLRCLSLFLSSMCYHSSLSSTLCARIQTLLPSLPLCPILSSIHPHRTSPLLLPAHTCDSSFTMRHTHTLLKSYSSQLPPPPLSLLFANLFTWARLFFPWPNPHFRRIRLDVVTSTNTRVFTFSNVVIWYIL